jgi:hypothetical protein
LPGNCHLYGLQERKYNFRFIDKNNNVYVLAGGKDRQLDISNLYSNIDSMDTTIDGKKAVDSQAMGGCNTKLSPGRREVRLYRLRRVQLQEGILQVQDHQHHGCGASLRVKFGLPRRLREGHGPGTFAIPIRWSAAIGET